MIKSIFFDNDGVLVSTEHLVFEANQEVFHSLGIPYSLDDFKEHTLLTNKGSSGFLKERGFDAEFNERFIKLRKPIWHNKLGAFDHSIAGAETVLESIKDLELVITTSAKKEEFKRSHTKTNLLKYFDSFLTQEDYEKVKPEPDVYLKALKISKHSSSNILVIEDTPRGVQAAKAAGLAVVAIPHELTIGLDFSKANYVLNSILELPKLIQTFNSTTY